jgi:hypothetical protein
MRTVLSNVGCGAGVLLGLALASGAHAQADKAVKPAVGETGRNGIHRMEVFNGGRLTVRYFAGRVSPGESAALRDLERAENEANYVRDLQDLKSQYAYDESLLEPFRNLVNHQLYGFSEVSGGYGGWGYGGGLRYGGLAYGGLGYGWPYGALGYGWPVRATLGSGYGLGAGYGGFGGGTLVYSKSLANGMGYEGIIKSALAGTLGQQATPEYAASVERDLDRAIARAGSSPAIRNVLGLPDPKDGGYILPAAPGMSAPVVLVLKDGERLAGEKVEESKEWITLTTRDGKQRIRPSEVVRIIETKGGGTRPATD